MGFFSLMRLDNNRLSFMVTCGFISLLSLGAALGLNFLLGNPVYYLCMVLWGVGVVALLPVLQGLLHFSKKRKVRKNRLNEKMKYVYTQEKSEISADELKKALVDQNAKTVDGELKDDSMLGKIGGISAATGAAQTPTQTPSTPWRAPSATGTPQSPPWVRPTPPQPSV